MKNFISVCARCGNPIYTCDYNQTTGKHTIIISPHETLPQVLRTCFCTFENVDLQVELQKANETIRFLVQKLEKKESSDEDSSKTNKVLKD